MTAKLGTPKVEGEAVGGKDSPTLYFGTTKITINNNFDIVDAVGKENGQGMTATLFVKGGDEFIRVSTRAVALELVCNQRYRAAATGPRDGNLPT